MNTLDLCVLAKCASTPLALDSTLLPCNHKHRRQLIYHRIAHSEQPQDVQLKYEGIRRFQCPKLLTLHHGNHLQPFGFFKQKTKTTNELINIVRISFALKLTLYHVNAYILLLTYDHIKYVYTVHYQRSTLLMFYLYYR